MAECPLARGTGDAFKVDQNNPSTIGECMMNGFHRLLWKFKVVVNIANEGEVNAIGWEANGAVVTENCRRVGQVAFCKESRQMLRELW